MTVNGFPDRIIKVHDEEYLYFGGTSYLGMASQPDFQNILTDNIKKWGTFYGSSRNANIQLSVYEKAEKLFSEQLKAEASLTISSGTLAGKLVIEYLSKSKNTFYHYPKTHPAILAQNSLPLFIDGELHPTLKDNFPQDIVITADAILGLEVTPTNFDFLNEISSQKRITLVVDESHSLGIVGQNGNGICHTIPTDKLQCKIMVASLGKALGLSGGIIASGAKFINELKNEAVFISASGASPAYLGAYIEAQNIYKSQQKKLKSNLVFLFSELLPNKELKFDKNYPVIYSNNDTIFATLLQNGIVITSFKYPTYTKPMNRIVITANHTKQDLEKLIQILNTYDT